eukprot:2987575-Pyramimonas_sp.AAC.1
MRRSWSGCGGPFAQAPLGPRGLAETDGECTCAAARRAETTTRCGAALLHILHLIREAQLSQQPRPHPQ